MVGSAAIKQGRSANRKHTYFFFGLNQLYFQITIFGAQKSLHDETVLLSTKNLR